MTTVDARPQTRTSAGQFVKGQSGNPAGQPKGFGALIRERTNNGEDAVNLALSIMAGESIDGEKPNLKLRFQAMEWVVDRGWGKAVAVVEHTGAIDMNVALFDGVDNAALKLIVAAKAVLDAEQVIEGEMRINHSDGSQTHEITAELEAHDDGTPTV